MTHITNIIFIIFVCYMPLLGIVFPRIDTLNIRSMWLVFYSLILTFILYLTQKRKFNINIKWVGILLLFFLVVLASISWSPFISYDLQSIKEIIIKFLTPVLIAVIAMNLFYDNNNLKQYLKNVMAVSGILSFIAIIQIFLGKSSVEDELRVDGTLGNPNDLAIFLVLILPIILYALKNKIVSRLYGYSVLTISAFGILFTVSRKGIISMVLVFFLFFLANKQFKRLSVLMVLLIALGGILLSIGMFSGRFNQESIGNSITSKTKLAAAGWDMFLKQPILGWGYKGYRKNFKRYFPYSTQKEYSAHNIYITALSNYGLTGFIPFLLILLFPLYYCMKIYRNINRMDYVLAENMKSKAVVCLSSVIPFLFCGYFAGSLFINYIIIYVLYTHISILFATKF